MTELAATRKTIAERGKRLEYFTIAWNSLEGLVAVIAGGIAGSISLVGFEIDSFIEVTSDAVPEPWTLHCSAVYVGNRPNPLCWNDPFPFQQGIEAIGCEVLERLNFPGRPADLQRLNLLCQP